MSGALSAPIARLVWAVVPTFVGLVLSLVERAHQVGAGFSSFVFAGLEQRLFRFDYPLPTELRPSVTGQGYDGLGFYVLAVDPFSVELISGADDPAYRNQRILFPLAAWLLSQLSGGSVLVTMVVVNVAAACVTAWIVAGKAVEWGAHPGLGALAGLSPPMVVGTMYNTAEPLALALMIGAIVQALRARVISTSLLLALAVLTRETTLTVAVALLVWGLSEWLRTRRWPGWTAAAAIPAIVVFGSWQAFMRQRWGEFPVVSGGESRVDGVVPVLDTVRSVFSPITVDDPAAAGATQGLWWAGRVLVALVVVGALIAIVKSMRRARSGWPDLLTVLYATAAAPTLLTGPWLWTRQYTRSAGEWMLVSLLIIIKYPGPSSNVGMAALMLTSVIAVVL